MIEVNAENYEQEVTKSPIPVVVDFWGPRCVPCQALLPQVTDLAETYKEKLKIVKVDASKNRRLCLTLKVLGLPTFLIYKDGREIGRLTGETIKIGDIEKAIQQAL